MAKPIEFNEFYKLLRKAKNGSESDELELATILEGYKSPKESQGAYEELGKIFCFISMNALFEYTGLTVAKDIGELSNEIWEYLKKRMKGDLRDYTKDRVIKESKNKSLPNKIAKKWEIDKEELEKNLEGLAEYVIDGIVEIIK